MYNPKFASHKPKPQEYGADQRSSSEILKLLDVSEPVRLPDWLLFGGCYLLMAFISYEVWRRDWEQGDRFWIFIFIGILAGLLYYSVLGFVSYIWKPFLQSKEKRARNLELLRQRGELKSLLIKRQQFEHDLKQWEWFNTTTSQGYWLEKKDVILENAVKDLLEKNGFEVTLTPTVGDGGIDLIAAKSDEKYLIQCKGLNKPCGVATIRDAAGVQSIHHHSMIVICPRGFSTGAQETAKQASVGLMSVFELIAFAKQETHLKTLATGPRKIARYIKN